MKKQADIMVKELMNIKEKNVKNYIDFLLKKNEGFLISCSNNDLITFEPKLPKELLVYLQNKFTNYAIQNYSLETAQISMDNRSISFEAAFGPNDFVSFVTIPFNLIYRIYCYINNPSSMSIIYENNLIFNELYAKKIHEEYNQKKSLNLFLSNPENAKFKKKEE